MDNTSNTPVLLERISSKRIWFVILVNILVLSVIVGVSTRYGSQINHVELLGQQRVAHGNSTVDMQLQVRDMMPSHRHMNIDVYFEQNELRAAKYCKDNVETSLCQDLTHFMKTPYASSSDFFSNSFDSDSGISKMAFYMQEGPPVFAFEVQATITVYGLTESDITVFGADMTVNRTEMRAKINAYQMAHTKAKATTVSPMDATSSDIIRVGHAILKQERRRLNVQCTRGAAWCTVGGPMLHFDAVEYAGYNVGVSLVTDYFVSLIAQAKFTRNFGDVEATHYLEGFKLCFAFIAFFRWLQWRCIISEVPSASVEQRWIGLLLFALVLFNDPLYPLQLHVHSLSSSAFLPVLAVIFQATFWATLLLFWLVVFDHFRLEMDQKRLECMPFYAPKLAFMLIVWLSSVLVMCYNLNRARQDPTYTIRIHTTTFKFFVVLALFTIVVYITWLTCILVQLCRKNEIQALQRRFQLLLCGSIFTGVLALVGLTLSYFNVVNAQMGESTGMCAVFNLYVLTMSYFFQPVPSERKKHAPVRLEIPDFGREA